MDLKILSTVSVRCLKGALPFKVDRTGFIKGPTCYNNVDNIITLLNIIQLSEQQKGDGLVISLDTEMSSNALNYPICLLNLIGVALVMTLSDG